MNDLQQFIHLSRYAGQRFDLIQAGGGNTSLQLADGYMVIKASGFLLSDLTESAGHVKVSKQKVMEIFSNDNVLEIDDKRLRDAAAAQLVSDAVLDDGPRPSIETFLHILFHKFTLHTHPLVVNILTARESWQDEIGKLFPDATFVDYVTPGIELGLAIKDSVDEYAHDKGKIPKIMFMQNHGLIVSADTVEEVIALNEQVLSTIETHLSMNLARYKQVTDLQILANKVWGFDGVCYCCDDHFINFLLHEHKKFFISPPFSPDGYVFCGASPAVLNSLQDDEALTAYHEQHHAWPKIVLLDKTVYILAQSLRKAKEIEEVLKFHLKVVSVNKGEYVSLDQEEMAYLRNWEAEKYRQDL